MNFYEDTRGAINVLVEVAATKAMQQTSTNPTEQAQELARQAARQGFVEGLRAAASIYDGVCQASPRAEVTAVYQEMLIMAIDRWS